MTQQINLHVLGDGLTATAVRAAITRHKALYETSLAVADWVVVSPGIPFHQWPKTDKEIISEIELAYRLFHSDLSPYTPKLVGVTGTNGKSTICTLIAQNSGYPACGNIGVPLIEWFCADTQPEWLIVELSSYQLHACYQFRPDIAIISSFSADHLAWHQSKDHYRAAKAKLLQNIQQEPLFIADTIHAQFPEQQHLENVAVIKGAFPHLAPHLSSNLSLANACLNMLGKDSIEIKDAFDSVLPHRLEKVSSGLDRVFINDSKSTNPESCLAAMQACEAPYVLILCGEDKCLDLADFYKTVFEKAAVVIVFGGLVESLQAYKNQRSLFFASHLAEALALAYQYSSAGDCILFSPSSSSYDQFKGFEDRGAQFKKAVWNLEKDVSKNN